MQWPVSGDITDPWQNISGFYTPVTGWVRGSKLACTNNPLTHDYQMTNNSNR